MAIEETMKEAREKYWSELDSDGKIERMRRIVRNQGREIDELKEKVRKLRKHTHVGDGFADIAIPLDTRDESRFYGGKQLGPEEEYF